MNFVKVTIDKENRVYVVDVWTKFISEAVIVNDNEIPPKIQNENYNALLKRSVASLKLESQSSVVTPFNGFIELLKIKLPVEKGDKTD